MNRREQVATPLLARRQRQDIGRQLTAAAVAAAGIALLVAGVLLNLSLYAWSQASLEEDARVQARIAADNSAAALVFGDVAAANETLASLRASPTVASARLLTAADALFASYQRDAGPAPRRDASAARSSAGSGSNPDAGMRIDEPVMQHGRPVGRISLSVSLKPLHQRALGFAGLTVGTALLALAIAYLRVRRVRRDIDATELRVDQLAYIDAVTGLYNRHAANEHLRSLVAQCEQDGSGFVLMMLDLDDFKVINDSLGHPAGDQVLLQLARRLVNGLRRSDLVFRFGGDEFIVVCHATGQGDPATRLGEAALACLEAPLEIDGQQIHARGSVGIAQFPADASTAEALLRAADTAMYAAKSAGKNHLMVFSRSMHDAASAQLEMDAELRRAIDQDELVLHYQPIVDLRAGCVVGTEALVRWQHPKRGLLQPVAFIDMAERTGLITELGGWVLRAAARQQVIWAQEGLGDLFIAVNASGRQFRRGLLLQQVREALADSGADASRIQIEITEHTLVEDVAASIATLVALRQSGVRVAIDDFGTGLSSMSYLKRFPIDKLKIDRSFVRGLPDALEDAAIAQAIISLAHALGLHVVAEGVETDAQRAWLKERGAEHAQGYLFGRPVPPGQILAVVRDVQQRWGRPAPRLVQ